VILFSLQVLHRSFIKGLALGKLTGCEDDFAHLA